MEAKLCKLACLPREVGGAFKGEGGVRARESPLPEGERVERQVGDEVELEGVEVVGQLELEFGLPVTRPAAAVDYQRLARTCASVHRS